MYSNIAFTKLIHRCIKVHTFLPAALKGGPLCPHLTKAGFEGTLVVGGGAGGSAPVGSSATVKPPSLTVRLHICTYYFNSNLNFVFKKVIFHFSVCMKKENFYQIIVFPNVRTLSAGKINYIIKDII